MPTHSSKAGPCDTMWMRDKERATVTVVFSFDERFPFSSRYADSGEYGEKYNLVDPF
jgi:hypothetical protein